MSSSQFWSLEVRDQGASMFGFQGEPSSGLQMAAFSLCPHMAEGRRAGSLASYENTSHSRGILHDPITSQRSHLLITSRWGLGFQDRNLGGHIYSMIITKYNLWPLIGSWPEPTSVRGIWGHLGYSYVTAY